MSTVQFVATRKVWNSHAPEYLVVQSNISFQFTALKLDPSCCEAGCALFAALVAQGALSEARALCETAAAVAAGTPQQGGWAWLRLARLQKVRLLTRPFLPDPNSASLLCQV